MKTYLVILLALGLLLSACSDGPPVPNPPAPEEPVDPTDPVDPVVPPPDNPGTTAAVGRYGVVYIFDGPVDAGRITTSGLFAAYSQPIELPTQIGLAQDACSVVVGEAKPVAPPFTSAVFTELEPGVSATEIVAGDVLTVSSPGGVYTTLERDSGTRYFRPFDPEPLSLPPRDLSITIPGSANGFPAFDVAFPTVPEPFTLSVSGGDVSNVTADTTFSWTGAPSDDAYFWFAGAGRNAAGSSVNFACFAEDDGAFTFPAVAKEDLAAAGFTSGELFYAVRDARTRVIRDQTALDLAVTFFQNY